MTIGIIGYGNMGSCIADRLRAHYELWAFDKDESKVVRLPGINRAGTVKELLHNANVIILAVKPQDFGSMLEEIKGDAEGKLIISIAAGIPLAYMEKAWGALRLIRTMPNILVKVGKGITFLMKNPTATEADVQFAQKVFGRLGATFIVTKEEMMDAATAISGSGPGYYYDIIENKKINTNDSAGVEKFNKEFMRTLAECAVGLGFGNAQAQQIAKATTEGSYALLKASGVSVAELKKQITSKGGTTEAALAVLHSGGSLKEATIAARDRARELSKR